MQPGIFELAVTSFGSSGGRSWSDPMDGDENSGGRWETVEPLGGFVKEKRYSLEGHPRTWKWLITIVSKMAYKWGLPSAY